MTIDGDSISQPQKHAFISYMHEDTVRVDQLVEALEAAGVRVWRDKNDLPPGSDWQTEIRKAITHGSLAFIACFSDATASRETSYQFEELALAADQYRLRPPARSWLFPVRFNDVPLPDYNLGAGRSLDTIHRTDFFGPEHIGGLVRLANTVAQLLGQNTSASNGSPTSAADIGNARVAAEDPARTVKRMLRDPSLDIELDDFVMAVATRIRNQLASDPQLSVQTSAPRPDEVGLVNQVLERFSAYQNVVEPFAKILVVAGSWGEQKHSELWRRASRIVLNPRYEAGNSRLLLLQQFVPMYLSYVSAIASVEKSNFYSLEALTGTPIRTVEGAQPMLASLHPAHVFGQIEDWVPSAVQYSVEGQPATPEMISALKTGRLGKRHTPLPSYLHKVLRPLFAELLPDQHDFDERFDQAEALLGLKASVVKIEVSEAGSYAAGNWGSRYMWNPYNQSSGPDITLADEYKQQGERWAPIQQGLLGRRHDHTSGKLRLGEYDTHAIDEALPEFLRRMRGSY